MTTGVFLLLILFGLLSGMAVTGLNYARGSREKVRLINHEGSPEVGVDRIFGMPEALMRARRDGKAWALVDDDSLEDVTRLAAEPVSTANRGGLEWCMASRDATVRRQASQEYRQRYDVDAAELLRLVDELPAIRLIIVENLGALFGHEDVPGLVELLDHPVRKVRNVAVEALGRLRHGPSASRIRALAEVDDPAGVNRSLGRRAFARIVGLEGDAPKAEPGALSMAASDPTWGQLTVTDDAWDEGELSFATEQESGG